MYNEKLDKQKTTITLRKILVILCFSMACFFIISGCKKFDSIIVIDGWYNADFTKLTCESAIQSIKNQSTIINEVGCKQISACPEETSIALACSPDELQDLHQFENDMISSFSRNKECRDIHLFYLENPSKTDKKVADAIKKEHYTIMLDFIPGTIKQNWSMVNLLKNKFVLQGQNNASDTISNICKTIKERGGILEN